MSYVWTIAEQQAGQLKEVSFELLARGRPLADAMDTKLAALVIGHRINTSQLDELIERGADEVYVVQHRDLSEFVCENYSTVLARLITTYQPSIVLAAATTTGRTLMPHLAVRVKTGLTADCTELEIEPGTDNLLQTRPAVGGNIAENAGGGKAVKYGVTGRYVLGVELVTPTGEVVWLGGKATKDVSGYDLKQLVVGSEGTLGIVTKTIIRLIGLPKADSVLLALFETPEAAIGVVPAIMTHGTVPTSIEFMDRLTVQTSCAYLNESLPYEGCGAMLLIEIDGAREDQVQKDLLDVDELCEQHGATEVYVAEDATTKERIWSVRRNIAEALKVQSPVQSLEDIVVPTAQIPDLIPELERLSETYGMKIPCYGHAGDGNLHATLVKSATMDMSTWRRSEHACLQDLYHTVTGLGGKISGEHGIGIKRKQYLAEVANPTELHLMRAIKRAWDPNNIMNPGKIFDMDAERG